MSGDKWSYDARFAELRALEPGWDSYGAPAISPVAIDNAIAFLDRIGPDVMRFSTFPTPSGGVQLEYDNRSTPDDFNGMEFGFHANGAVTMWLFGKDVDQEEDGTLMDPVGT